MDLYDFVYINIIIFTIIFLLADTIELLLYEISYEDPR